MFKLSSTSVILTATSKYWTSVKRYVVILVDSCKRLHRVTSLRSPLVYSDRKYTLKLEKFIKFIKKN